MIMYIGQSLVGRDIRIVEKLGKRYVINYVGMIELK